MGHKIVFYEMNKTRGDLKSEKKSLNMSSEHPQANIVKIETTTSSNIIIFVLRTKIYLIYTPQLGLPNL